MRPWETGLAIGKCRRGGRPALILGDSFHLQRIASHAGRRKRPALGVSQPGTGAEFPCACPFFQARQQGERVLDHIVRKIQFAGRDDVGRQEVNHIAERAEKNAVVQIELVQARPQRRKITHTMKRAPELPRWRRSSSSRTFRSRCGKTTRWHFDGRMPSIRLA